MSRDGVNWVTLLQHSDERGLSEPGGTATWPLPEADSGDGPYRHVRLQQNGKNASAQTHYLSLSGFEIYGHVS